MVSSLNFETFYCKTIFLIKSVINQFEIQLRQIQILDQNTYFDGTPTTSTICFNDGTPTPVLFLTARDTVRSCCAGQNDSQNYTG